MTIARFALPAALLLALIAVAGTSVALFSAHAPTFYGTALAPHSDALTSWLHGTLGFYFYDISHNSLLLRPLITVLYAGVLTMAELTGHWSLEIIPAAFTALYGAALVAVFPLLDTRGRLALLTLAGMTLVWRGALIAPLAPDSLNTDYPSFALTMAGLLLTLVPLAQDRPTTGARALILTGWVFLALSAVIRGPGLAFAPALLLIQFLVLRARLGGWRAALPDVLAAGAVFAAFFIADAALRATAGVGPQGLLAFYAFYADPGHTLTNDAYFRYVELKPGAAEVLGNYVAFLLSEEGWRTVRDAVWLRFAVDGATLLEVRFPWIMAGALAADLMLTATAAARGGGSPWRALLTPGLPVKLALTLAGLAAAVDFAAYAPALAPYVSPYVSPWSVVAALCGLTLVWSVATGRFMAAGFVLTYLLGTLFIVLTGTKEYTRIVHSFVLALYAAPLWVLLEPAGRLEWTTARRAAAGTAAGIFALTALAALGANFLLPTPMKSVYRSEARGRPAAMKLSEDPRLDRALYFSGRREVLYTRADGVPPGAVRSTVGFENPNGPIGVPEELDGLRAFNALFENPGRFAPPPQPETPPP